MNPELLCQGVCNKVSLFTLDLCRGINISDYTLLVLHACANDIRHGFTTKRAAPITSVGPLVCRRRLQPRYCVDRALLSQHRHRKRAWHAIHRIANHCHVILYYLLIHTSVPTVRKYIHTYVCFHQNIYI